MTDGGSGRQATPFVYGYFAVLLSLTLLPVNLASIPLGFLYKDHLHMSATGAATFKLIVSLPGYLAFAFGVVRDRFSPMRMGDRGFMLVCGLGIGLLFIALGRAPLNLFTLGLGLILVASMVEMSRAAYQALMRNVAEARSMSGRMSTTYQFLNNGVPMVTALIGGWLSAHIAWQNTAALIGLTWIGYGLFALWKPTPVYGDVPETATEERPNLRAEFAGLFRHRAVWIAAAIWGLWAFSPGANTPLLYYMSDRLKLNPAQYGIYMSLFTGLCVPTILLFGPLSKRFSLWPLLLIATIVGIPQMLPLTMIHNAPQAYVAGAVMALSGGFANAAFWTVVIRACPKALAGAGMLLAISAGHVAVQGSDVFGGWLYARGGFGACAWVTTIAYVGLLPLIFAMPRDLTRPKDGEPDTFEPRSPS